MKFLKCLKEKKKSKRMWGTMVHHISDKAHRRPPFIFIYHRLRASFAVSSFFLFVSFFLLLCYASFLPISSLPLSFSLTLFPTTYQLLRPLHRLHHREISSLCGFSLYVSISLSWVSLSPSVHSLSATGAGDAGPCFSNQLAIPYLYALFPNFSKVNWYGLFLC